MKLCHNYQVADFIDLHFEAQHSPSIFFLETFDGTWKYAAMKEKGDDGSR